MFSKVPWVVLFWTWDVDYELEAQNHSLFPHEYGAMTSLAFITWLQGLIIFLVGFAFRKPYVIIGSLDEFIREHLLNT
jgi:hypothetical protein